MSTPTVAELEAGLNPPLTAAAIETGDLADVYLAAEAEEALYAEVCTGPCDTPETGRSSYEHTWIRRPVGRRQLTGLTPTRCPRPWPTASPARCAARPRPWTSRCRSR